MVSVTLAGTEVKSIDAESDTLVKVVAADAAANSGAEAVVLLADTGAVITATPNGSTSPWER